MRRRRFLLLDNPIAGLRRRLLTRQVLRAMQKRGAEVVALRLWGVPRFRSPGNLVKAIELDGFDAVVAAGGDGTVRAIASALGSGLSLPIGLVPAGTGNVLAVEIGMPRSAAAIADVLIDGPVVTVPGATANGEAFFLMAGVGFDGDIVARLDLALKRRIGKAAYVWPVLRRLAQSPPPPFEVEVDGAVHEATWIVAAKGRHYGGTFVLAPDAGLLADGLHCVLFKARTRRGRLLELLAIGAGLHARLKSLAVVPCRRVVVRTPGLPLQVDGDVAGTSPVEISADSTAMQLIVPPGWCGQERHAAG